MKRIACPASALVVSVLLGVLSAPGYVESYGGGEASTEPHRPDSPSALATQWVKLFGSSGTDTAYDVDRYRQEDLYVVGCTTGDMGGEKNAGGKDAFLARISAEGNLIWVRLLGTSRDDCAHSVYVNQGAGYYPIYVTGYTLGDLAGQQSSGAEDAFVASYSVNGSRLYVTLLGTTGSDYGNAISSCEGSCVLVGGSTWENDLDGTDNNGNQREMENSANAFLAKVDDVDGNVEGVALFGWAAHESVDDIDNNNWFGPVLTGTMVQTTGGLPPGSGYNEAFIARFDRLLNLQWYRYFGTELYDDGFSIAWYPSGRIAVTGRTNGDLYGEDCSGEYDAYTWVDEAQYNYGYQWHELIGTAGRDEGIAVATDVYGQAYVVGNTSGDLHGETMRASMDVFLTRYHYISPGFRDFTRLLGADDGAHAAGVTVEQQFGHDRVRDIYVAGSAGGRLHGQTVDGDSDVFVWKLAEGAPGTPPELVMNDFDDGRADEWQDDGSGSWDVIILGVPRLAADSTRALDPSADDYVYAMTGTQAGRHAFSHHSWHACDFTYEADVAKHAGDSAEILWPYGLVFRSDAAPGQEIPRNYYQFAIATSGEYTFGKRVAGGELTKIVDWTSASALSKGKDAWNRLKVVASGQEFALYANGTLLDTVTDDSFDCGRIGLVAIDSASSEEADTVLFDNVRLLGPDASGALPTPTATATSTAGGAINGVVTHRGSPAAGVELTLRHHDGEEWSTAATTTTRTDGRYEFRGISPLDGGERYYVRFGPNRDDTDRLYVWHAADITALAAGQSVGGGDFDIGNVELLAPTGGTTAGLPATFVWRLRGVATDSYRWMLYDDATESQWGTSELGHVDRFELRDLPDSVHFDEEYAWHVRVHSGPDSYGVSYYQRNVTFTSRNVPTPSPWPTPTATGTPRQTAAPTASRTSTSRPGTPSATPDLVQTRVAQTLTAMAPTVEPTTTPDTVGTSVAATLTALAPGPQLEHGIYLPVAMRNHRSPRSAH